MSDSVPPQVNDQMDVAVSDSVPPQVNDQMDVAVSEPVPPQVNDQMDVAVSDSVPPQVNDQMDVAVSDSVPPQVNDQMDVAVSDSVPPQVNDQMDVAVSDSVPPQVNDQMDEAVSDSVPPQVNDQMDVAVSDSVPPQVNDQMDVAVSDSVPMFTSKAAKGSRTPFISAGVSMISVGALTLTATLFSQFNVLNFAEMLPLSNEVMIAMTTVSTVFLVLGIVVSMVQPKIPAEMSSNHEHAASNELNVSTDVASTEQINETLLANKASRETNQDSEDPGVNAGVK